MDPENSQPPHNHDPQAHDGHAHEAGDGHSHDEHDGHDHSHDGHDHSHDEHESHDGHDHSHDKHESHDGHESHDDSHDHSGHGHGGGGCGHDHDHGLLGHHHDHTGTPEHALKVALYLNGFYLIVEVVVGITSGSLALLADAGHMVSDVGSLALALAAQKIALSDASSDYTFGWRRVPVIGGLINGITLLIVVALIFREAIERFWDPVAISGEAVLIVGTIGLFVNVGSAWYLWRVQDSSVNIRGAFLHLVADALGSVAAIGSALIIMFTGWNMVDPLLSVLIAGLILLSSWPLLRETINIVLQRAPSSVSVDGVRAALLEGEGVAEVLDLHVWELNSGQHIASVVLLSEHEEKLSTLNVQGDLLRKRMRKDFSINHVTIEWRCKGTLAPVDELFDTCGGKRTPSPTS